MSETEVTKIEVIESGNEVSESEILSESEIEILSEPEIEIVEKEVITLYEVITPGPEPGHSGGVAEIKTEPVQEPEREFDFKFFLNKAYDRIEELESKLKKMDHITPEYKPRGCFSFLKNKK